MPGKGNIVTINSTTRTPREGDYAVLDKPGGWRVLCNRRFPGDRYCRQVLALIEMDGTDAGRPRRVVVFTCAAWRQYNGVWCLPTADKKRLKQGRTPRSQPVVGPFHLWRTDQWVNDSEVILGFQPAGRSRSPTPSLTPYLPRCSTRSMSCWTDQPACCPR